MFRSFFYAILFISFVFSQNEKKQEHEDKLQKLKEEIADLKESLSQLEEDESNVANDLKAAEYNIKLSQKNLELIKQKLGELSTRINANLFVQEKLGSEVKEIKESYAKRMFFVYTLPKISDWDVFFNADNISQFVRFKRYKIFIDEAEDKLVTSLRTKQKKLNDVKQKLVIDKQDEEENLVDEKKEFTQLANEKETQKDLLNKIKKDKNFYSKVVAEKENEQEKIRQLIAELSKKSSARTSKTYSLNKDFEKNKGKFIWPHDGKVIRPFGKVKHPKFQIYEDNTGVDIGAKEGDEVKSIFTGVVVKSDYIPTFGNTVILDHGYGFFTLYSHLADLKVKDGDLVSPNQIIGTVGNSGTFDGITKLHFEIYSDNKAVNPVKWLQ
jgi:murein DD-endopeptidase MepM/ murein hydrolase activator NlpD